MKTLFILSLIFTSGIAMAQQNVPDGCPTDDAQLIAAVDNGQKIACTIDYFTGGHGGQWKTTPDNPNAMDTIAEACLDSQKSCNNNINCVESAYYNCVAQ